MPKLKVCIVVDVEDFISFRIWNPEWTLLQNVKLKIAGLLAPFRYDKRGYRRIHQLALKYKFPLSFMLVGSLFKPLTKHEFIDYGFHSFSHKPLTYISDEGANKEIKNIYNALTFSAPMNLIDDPLQPRRIFRMLKKEGYKICVWTGSTIRDKEGRVVILPPRKKIAKPIKVGGIACIYISNFFDGKTSKKSMNGIINEVKANSDKDAIYCLTTHDFSNKNIKNFEFLIRNLKDMESKNRIKIVNLRWLL